MKHLLIFPPIWQPITPYLAIPSLLGQLKKEGFDAEGMDLNIEFYDDLLKKTYLEKTIKNIEKIAAKTSDEAKKYDTVNKKTEDYPIEIQAILLKDKKIKEYLQHKSNNLKIIPALIENAVSTIKDPQRFYDPKYLFESYKIINYALEIASLPYAPASVSFDWYENPLFKNDYENIKFNVFSKSTNIFSHYFEKWVPIIKKKKPKYIGISITTICQLIPGLTLASLLKKHTNAHINIGGKFFSGTVDKIIEYPDFFKLFADSISINEGERPIIELAKYINNEISIEEVPNLIYRKNNEIRINEDCAPIELDKIPTPNFDDFNFSKYITPKIVLPIETTRGCYWSKCTFCDIPSDKKYNVKNIDKLINELKEYNQKYGISHFCLADDCTHPTYLEKMAEKILENKLNVNYYCPSRTEESFTKNIVEKASKSGLRMVFWGIESGSKRVLKLMNKGIDVDYRMELLQESSKNGIWNHAFAFLGFPSETLEEAKETIEMFAKNSDLLNSCLIGTFNLREHSIVGKNLKRFGITPLEATEKDKMKFTNIVNFNAEGMTDEEMQKALQLWHKTDKEIYGSALWRYLRCYQYLFLYIDRYGCDWVKNHKFKID